MEMIRSEVLNLQIENDSDIGVCRRKSVNHAKQLGFDDIKAGEVAIIVTELVTNVIKHGGGEGRILVNTVSNERQDKAIEIWCCDKGEGIPDLEKAVLDGYTEKGTLGIGLGSIRRFSDEFELNPKEFPNISDSGLSGFEQYTNCIRVLKWLPSRQWQGTNRDLTIGAISKGKSGEVLNGDCYMYNHISADRTIAAVIDGLGHGKQAHMASQLAKEQLFLKSNLPVNALLEHVHNALKGTRGVVIGLVMIDTEKSKIFFSGIGNIEGFVINNEGDKKSLISFGGIIGHKIRTPRVFEYPFSKGDMVCLFSDGVTTRWSINDLDLKNHPQQIAEFIVNNYSRQNDDATVLIIRNNP